VVPAIIPTELELCEFWESFETWVVGGMMFKVVVKSAIGVLGDESGCAVTVVVIGDEVLVVLAVGVVVGPATWKTTGEGGPLFVWVVAPKHSPSVESINPQLLVAIVPKGSNHPEAEATIVRETKTLWLRLNIVQSFGA
jgi:hypothetical protein